MSRIAKTLVVVFLAALVVSLQAAENLTEEQSLPVHADRDAYTPASAFLKDSYLVVWQSGRLAPGDLRPQKAFLNLSGESQLIAGAYLCWDGSAFVAACTEFLSNGKWIHRGPNQIEGIMVARISPEGQTLAFLLVASGKDVPATNACVASDRAGTSLIAYEKQHATPEKPIEIGYRILTAK